MFKIFYKYIFVLVFCLFFSMSLKANTLDNLKNQFNALGGSTEGFNKIIQVVQKSQSASSQLKEKITQTHNKKMFDIMVAPNFDSKAYTQAYNNLEQDKAQLITQNLNEMINLLNSLSVKDRQAYAQLLYGVSNTVSNAPGEVENSSGESHTNGSNEETNH